ncbi:hypothetical protein A0H81_07768 [Grifola frondosa]|uniref:Uncharacterized protein n=1 Tax=Grifola frondosa TaxID=5627 RepID=A0A1C7M6C6_GRIFR|nr:hypothetical protein A0H81_07768 [Grifola frondosa]
MAKHSTTPQTRPSVSMALVGAIRFSELPPSPVLTLKIPGILSHFGAEHLGATHAVRILVRAGRLRAAKQLYSEVCARQTPSVRTVMGNTILHGSMLHPSRRNARTMRKVLDVLNNLVKGCAFVPDRVTVNILVKTLLRWTKDIDAQKARVLFDRVIRSGYPTGTVEQGSVPFGTEAAASPQGFEIPKLDSSISFVRHVRPLYKMFIKAFYLRGDVHAARTVVGILKAVEAGAMDVERRERFKIARGLDDNHARTSG